MIKAESRKYGIAKLVLLLTILMATVVSLMGSTFTASVQSKNWFQKGLVGTWRIEVTPYNCETGVTNPSFPTMISFELGGTTTESASSPAFQPGQRGPGHGVWRYSGGHTYDAVFEAFINFTSAPNPPVPGFTKGVQRVTQTITVNGDQLTADASAEFLDAQGNPVVTLCTSAVGERMKLD